MVAVASLPCVAFREMTTTWHSNWRRYCGCIDDAQRLRPMPALGEAMVRHLLHPVNADLNCIVSVQSSIGGKTTGWRRADKSRGLGNLWATSSPTPPLWTPTRR